MFKFATCLATLLAGLFVLSLEPSAQDPGDQDAAKVLLGTFDSRVLAIAYYNSNEFEQYLTSVHEKHAKAEAAGDSETAKKLEQEMGDKQKHIHGQGFGNAPIPEILAKLESDLPRVAKRAGVDVIVSKWDLVYRRPSAETVDVSFLLAEAFEPDEKTRKSMKEIFAQKPVPLDQLTHDH